LVAGTISENLADGSYQSGEATQGAEQNSPTPPSPSNAQPEAEVVELKVLLCEGDS